jgi:hypothetical protein
MACVSHTEQNSINISIIKQAEGKRKRVLSQEAIDIVSLAQDL